MFVKNVKLCFLFLLYSYIVCGEVVKYFPCFSNKTVQNCIINEVQVEPCPEASTEDPCQLYKNQDAKIVFTFTPNFTSNSLSARVYSSMAFIDLPLPNQDTNACLYTSCPVTAGKPQIFKFTLPIAEYYPSGPYLTKWKIWANITNDEECCFMTKVSIA